MEAALAESLTSSRRRRARELDFVDNRPWIPQAVTAIVAGPVPMALALSPGGTLLASGTLLATGSADNTVRVCNPATGELVRMLKGHTGDVNAVAFSPDGTLLASGSEDNMVRVWDPAAGVCASLPATAPGSTL